MNKSKSGSNKTNGNLDFSKLSYSTCITLAVVISLLISTINGLNDYGNIWVIRISLSAWISSLLICLKHGHLNQSQRKVCVSSFISTTLSLFIYKTFPWGLPLGDNQEIFNFLIPFLAQTLIVAASIQALFCFFPVDSENVK
jgi:hypothetical protein